MLRLFSCSHLAVASGFIAGTAPVITMQNIIKILSRVTLVQEYTKPVPLLVVCVLEDTFTSFPYVSMVFVKLFYSPMLI